SEQAEPLYVNQEDIDSGIDSGSDSNSDNGSITNVNLYQDDEVIYETPNLPTFIPDTDNAKKFPQLFPETVKVVTGAEDQEKANSFMQSAIKGRAWFNRDDGTLKITQDAFRKKLMDLPIGALRDIAVANPRLSTKHGYAVTPCNMAKEVFCDKLIDQLVKEYGVEQVNLYLARIRYTPYNTGKQSMHQYALHALQRLKQE
ncbi:MAG: hypothetical protein ACPG5T_06480, partial [Endozoicomonas sp.]